MEGGVSLFVLLIMFAYYFSCNPNHLSNLLLLVWGQCENCGQIDIEGVDTEYRLEFNYVSRNEIIRFQCICFVVASNGRDEPVTIFTECHHFFVVYDKNKVKVY